MKQRKGSDYDPYILLDYLFNPGCFILYDEIHCKKGLFDILRSELDKSVEQRM